MNHYAAAALLTFITSIVLTIVVFFKDRSRPLNRVFIQLCLILTFYGLAFFNTCTSVVPAKSLFWGKTTMFTSIFFAIAYLHLSLVASDYTISKKLLKILYSIVSIYILVDFPTNLILRDPRPAHGIPMMNRAGILYIPSVILFLGIITYTIFRILNAMKVSSPSKKNQLKYFIIAPAIAVIGGSSNFIVAYDFTLYPLNPFIGYLAPLFNIIIAYAIVKHRLMDINIAIRKVISNFILVLFFSLLVISIYLLKSSLVLKILLTSILGTIVSAYLPHIKLKIENLINRLLYGTKYDYQETLVEVSDTVPTIIDLNKLLKYITDKICKSMRIAKGATLLKDDFGNKYSVQYQHGFDGEMASSMKLEAQGPLVSRIKNVEDVLVRHEMIQILGEKDYNGLCADLDKFDAEVVVPIRKGDNILGLLILSDKASGDTFGQEDFRLLHIIAIQSAVAIENIRLYNKLIHTDRQTFLETLASGVSHEIRNRLVAIRTFIDLFPERVQKEHVEPGYFEFRNLAAREMERLTKIIDGLLSYSRAVSKGGEELKVNALIEESILIIESKFKDKDIKLIKNLVENVTSIRGDKGRLLQVFINIMQNGIEAMDKNGQLTITSIEKDNEIEVDISDTGKGIDKDHIDAIFEPFFTTKHQGTGLGLSIVQRIVHDHNGHIRVESELGKGTTFFVTFQKGVEYRPEEIKAEEKLGYWEVKKESEKEES